MPVPLSILDLAPLVTDHIRLGSGAVQTGHQTALSIVEQFGLLDALYPGRFDLGLGRSGQRRKEALSELGTPPPPVEERVADGLLIPKPFSFAPLLASARTALFVRLLQQPGAGRPDFPEVLDEIEALLAGPITDADGNEARAVAGAGADLQLWILGSSGGQSAREAGRRGLPFAANYHVAPAKVLEAVDAYRSAFRPSAVLPAPHVMVSADVVVAADDETARELAAGVGLWVHSIRTGAGARPYPSPAEVAAHGWTAEERDLVTTVTHDHADRVHSFELLAKEWLG